MQLTGIHHVTAISAKPHENLAFYTGLLGMRLVKKTVLAMGEGGPAAEPHVIEQRDLPAARQGAGGAHHVAFRTPGEAQYHAWAPRLSASGTPNSFEIGTNGPGFATDEPMETLGEKLALPPFQEPRRAEIEAGLNPIGQKQIA